MSRMSVVLSTLFLLLLLSSLAAAQTFQSARVPIPHGYEDYWRGAGHNGTDSLYHRVTFLPDTLDDTLVAVMTNGQVLTLPTCPTFTEVYREESLFGGTYYTAYRYRSCEERRNERGLTPYLSDRELKPIMHIRVRDCRQLFYKLADGTTSAPTIWSPD